MIRNATDSQYKERDGCHFHPYWTAISSETHLHPVQLYKSHTNRPVPLIPTKSNQYIPHDSTRLLSSPRNLIISSHTMATSSSSDMGMVAYRATSLFQSHRTRQALRDAHEGKIPPLMGLYLGLSSIPTARFIAPLGFDAVWVDWEHSSCNVETMTTVSIHTGFYV